MGELFCGPGGLAIGAELANQEIGIEVFKHTWAVDNHAETCQTYLNNVKGAKQNSVICSDVRDLNFDSLKGIDGFAYGFPCNDFSLVGEHKGFTGDFGPLYTYGLPVLSLYKPKFFIAENVGGIRSANEGKAFLKILDDLSKAGDGYELTPHLYKFENYGVPQSRHRVIIVGIRKDLGLKFLPPSTKLFKKMTAKDALTKPPIKKTAFNNEFTKQNPRVVERLSFIKPGENAWTAELPEELKLNVTGAKISQIYRRLDPDKPSYTVTGSGGGGTHVYHWSENRALTNRERARLQTFPDEFNFHGSKESVRRQIGMAVPPQGAKALFIAIYKTLKKIKYETDTPNINLDW
jgi:DNA (cytosine-5)-methyltransferase 1